MTTGIPNPESMADAIANVAEESQKLVQGFMEAHGVDPTASPDPLGVYPAYQALIERMWKDPTPMIEAQTKAWQDYMAIWSQTTQRFFGMEAEPVIKPNAGDRRFKADEWQANPFFDFIKQTYLLTASTMQKTVSGVEGLSEQDSHKVQFFTQQFVDALSPSNFVASNPEVIRRTMESGGQNLLRGLKNFLGDIDPKTGRLNTKMVDGSAFELGKNVAATPGKVIFQTDLMQLIQYAPTTETVLRRPILIVPPWINKFYVLDLQPRNSFIKWAVDQGHTVFIVSWINPDEKLRDKDFEDYLLEGPYAALDAIEQATGEREVNLIGYCLGGTLAGALLAYLNATDDTRVCAATFFTSLLDFSDPGDLGVFIDEEQVASLEQQMQKAGYLDGAEMATTFNMLRSNDLIWSFFVNNYLLGESPMPFDLLYWNADSTRMPARMHSTYLRKMYMQNAFRKPGGIKVAGVPLDLTQVETPCLFVSAAEDHIAPWKTTYKGAQVFAGPVDFILAKSGHIAGIINPPGPKAYGYFTGPDIKNLTADEWFEQTQPLEQSWWPTWQEWIVSKNDDRVPARVPGDGNLPCLEDAPGSYVKIRVR